MHFEQLGLELPFLFVIKTYQKHAYGDKKGTSNDQFHLIWKMLLLHIS